MAVAMKRRLAGRPGVYRRARQAADLARWAARRPHERDFEYFRHAPAPAPGRVFLDVGANTGISALCFRLYDKRTPIVSVEPNATLEDDLRLVGRLIGGFSYRLVAAGEDRGSFTLYTPCFRGTPLVGEASLERPGPGDVWWIHEHVGAPREGEFTVTEQQVEVIPLDELGLAPAHVKIDVEGTELAVLRGLRGTLERYRPTVLLERSGDFETIRAWLGELAGYEAMSWDRDARRLVAYDPGIESSNAFFVPAPDGA